jgi:hypothetical protein
MRTPAPTSRPPPEPRSPQADFAAQARPDEQRRRPQALQRRRRHDLGRQASNGEGLTLRVTNRCRGCVGFQDGSDPERTRNCVSTGTVYARPAAEPSGSARLRPSRSDVSPAVAALSQVDTQGLTRRRGAWGRGFCTKTVTFSPQAWSHACCRRLGGFARRARSWSSASTQLVEPVNHCVWSVSAAS